MPSLISFSLFNLRKGGGRGGDLLLSCYADFLKHNFNSGGGKGSLGAKAF